MGEKVNDVFQRLGVFCDFFLKKSYLKIIRRIAVISAVMSCLVFLSITFSVRQDWIHIPNSFPFLYSYYFSFYAAFTFILTYETLTMIFTIPYSIANSVGKQFEIVSLIILRYIFEHLGKYADIHHFIADWKLIQELLVIILGVLSLFFLIQVYYKIQKHKAITSDVTTQNHFVTIKKLVALSLVVVLTITGIIEMKHLIEAIQTNSYERLMLSHVFFKKMFTIMIFFDVFLVMITMWYSASYNTVFRLSALTISTVLLRLSFTDHIETSVLIAVIALLFAIGVSWVYGFYEQNELSYKS